MPLAERSTEYLLEFPDALRLVERRRELAHQATYSL